MTTATHADCPRCSSFQPVVWTPVTIAQADANDRVGDGFRAIFKGLEMKCRKCDFEITKIGTLETA